MLRKSDHILRLVHQILVFLIKVRYQWCLPPSVSPSIPPPPSPLLLSSFSCSTCLLFFFSILGIKPRTWKVCFHQLQKWWSPHGLEVVLSFIQEEHPCSVLTPHRLFSWDWDVHRLLRKHTVYIWKLCQ